MKIDVLVVLVIVKGKYMDMCIILWINIEFNLFFCRKFCVFFFN